jgi:hypothetical protein
MYTHMFLARALSLPEVKAELGSVHSGHLSGPVAPARLQLQLSASSIALEVLRKDGLSDKLDRLAAEESDSSRLKRDFLRRSS